MAPAQIPAPDSTIVYKSVGEHTLSLYLFNPPNHNTGSQQPAIVFFFGGGWMGGSPGQFYPHCYHLSAQGMVAISAEYRVQRTHGTTPFECAKDGRSAMRYVRAHAKDLGIDPDRLAAGGGSAGGHVAAATGTLKEFDEPGEDTSTSCRPDALVLFNPVYDNGPEGYGYERVKERYQEFSPLHNIDGNTPPAIVFLGTKDSLIPVSTAETFKSRMEEAGVRSDLHLYEDQPHGFFNYRDGNSEYYTGTVRKMDLFLQSLGYLDSGSAS